MYKLILLFLFFCFTTVSFSQNDTIISTVDSTNASEIVLIQSFTVHSSIDSVWKAFTTKEGLENWSVPLAEVDLKIGGSIQSNYNPAGKIGDSTTIYTHIINYVPYKLLTLQAEVSEHFPEFMKADAKDFYNVILFEELKDDQVQITSYGIGYKNTPKYLSLLKFFIAGNESSYKELIKYLEQ
ncbi:Uncharacterized conserved protein YndB, AHSA1/START domain [Lishizhenia tianjinensis]|uniref:Uncharacterized conserved protein YndB, AHSA1/START domain n=1 Tax=Lishizhenia tianjinensis TaxID=477690 RepID=A0A1I7BPV9_9FLAO|nr:SRPBCC domain-containing protein [Lishizhenia tianjinensis]SFT89196.1 Uncharacterized conserved protein YndB, AHSA1/START domain [Lishizhenia tianjinensis]